jgi:hypothetical protein
LYFSAVCCNRVKKQIELSYPLCVWRGKVGICCGGDGAFCLYSIVRLLSLPGIETQSCSPQSLTSIRFERYGVIQTDNTPFIILSRIQVYSVTIDGVWIGNRLYWTLWYSAWLHFTVHYYTHTHTSVYSHVFTSRCSVAATNSGRSASSGFPNYPRAWTTSSHRNKSQRLNHSSPLTNSLAHQPTNSSQS